MKHANQSKDSIAAETVSYAFGRVEQWIRDFAESHQLPAHELGARISALLFGQASGEALGVGHSLPGVPRPGRKATERSQTVEPMALVKRPYRKAQVKRTWKEMTGKPHWTQTPAGRRRNRKHMEDMRLARMKKAA